MSNFTLSVDEMTHKEKAVAGAIRDSLRDVVVAVARKFGKSALKHHGMAQWVEDLARPVVSDAAIHYGLCPNRLLCAFNAALSGAI